MPRDDRLSLTTYLAFAPRALMSAIFGPILYFLPDRTDTLFAWTIMPAMSAVFIGAGYISGALIIVRLLLMGRWYAMRPFSLGGWGFIVAMLGATLLHWDRFHQGTAFFYIWFIVYLLGPFIIPIAYWRNEPRYVPPAPGEMLLQPSLRRGLMATGLIFTLLGLALFISPASFAPIWPWTLTPLIGRVIAGWMFLPAFGAIGAFIEPRYTAFRPLMQHSLGWIALLLVGSLLHLSDFNFARPLAWGWFVMLVVSFGAAFLAYRQHEALYQANRGTTVPRVVTAS
jgi:hypothetical protein